MSDFAKKRKSKVVGRIIIVSSFVDDEKNDGGLYEKVNKYFLLVMSLTVTGIITAFSKEKDYIPEK
ncbi:hypothetical protein OKW24_003683 [Peribacillus simplex]|nr:hypothetical protein [Peribacillus simplex]